MKKDTNERENRPSVVINSPPYDDLMRINDNRRDLLRNPNTFYWYFSTFKVDITRLWVEKVRLAVFSIVESPPPPPPPWRKRGETTAIPSRLSAPTT